MQSPISEKAVVDAQKHGKAILKFISANDAGLTGSHQAGFYLPKSVWHLYTPHPPINGRNDKSKVKIEWQGGAVTTDSVVTWYGQKTRDEYRLTRFGKGFPYLNEDSVGDMLILIPLDLRNFLAYVIDIPDDIDDVQAELGVEAIGTWAVFDREKEPEALTEDGCIDQKFRQFAKELAEFPTGEVFTTHTREVLLHCITGFRRKKFDERLMLLMQNEYRLFKLVERQICLPQVCRLFRDIDDFIKTAATFMNRRKSRAGRSFENHVQYLLTDADIPFAARPAIEGEPDIVIPSKDAYDNPDYPIDKLFMLGVKTTCKDRWRQILPEAPRIKKKHLLTIQEGVSAKQLKQMRDHNVSLIVPKKLHRRYPKVEGVKLLKVDTFIANVKWALA